MQDLELTQILEDIDRRVHSDPMDGLAASVDGFRAILARKLHLGALNGILRTYVEQENGEGIFTSGKFLVLATTKNVELSLVRYTAPMSHIYSSPNAFMQAQLSAGSFAFDRYECSTEINRAVFDDKVCITPAGSGTIDDATVIVKKLSEIVDLHSFSTCPTIFLRLAQAPQGDFEWAFDKDSLRAHSYCTIRLPESNLCGLFELLADHADERTVTALEPFLGHPLHFVRWKAVQTIGRCDRDYGLDLARRSLDDVHPHVQSAARATLAKARSSELGSPSQWH